jgi:NTE family protein
MADKFEVQHSIKEIFLVMQGGGAKGVAHAGGLIAIEEEALSIKGIAGTSAGSIAAALVAAGYTGKELADPMEQKHLFLRAPFGKEKGALPYSKPTQLFTPLGWLILSIFKAIPGLPARILSPFSSRWALFCWWTLIFALPAGVLVWMTLYVSETLQAFPAAIWQGIKLAAPWLLLAVVVLFVWGLWGITSVRNVRKIIDRIIARKLADRLKKAGINKNCDITFEDMDRAGCPPLKIIATNTATESLELFCAERTPDVAVADAVAASVCLPIIFKPKRLTFTRRTPFADVRMKGKFLDGGLVSNLPAWALDEERLLHPGVPTIALSLSPPAPVNNKFWFAALTGTVVNGSSEVHTRTPNKILTVALETKATLLDFDMPAASVYAEVAAAQARVTTELSVALRGPVVLQQAVRELHEGIQAILKTYQGALYHPRAKDRIRVGIAVQRGNSMKTLSTAFTAGYRKTDPDVDLTVLLKDSHAGTAWAKGAVIVDDLGDGTLPRFQVSPLAWSAKAWLLCVPVVGPTIDGKKARPIVITIDSNVAFNRDSPDFEELYHDFCTFITTLVESYTESMELAQYAQGANTWL